MKNPIPFDAFSVRRSDFLFNNAGECLAVIIHLNMVAEANERRNRCKIRVGKMESTGGTINVEGINSRSGVFAHLHLDQNGQGWVEYGTRS